MLNFVIAQARQMQIDEILTQQQGHFRGRILDNLFVIAIEKKKRIVLQLGNK